MKTLRSDIQFKGDASRVELLVRFVYWIPLVLVLFVVGLVAWFVEIVQFVYILALGRRQQTLAGFLASYVKYRFQISAYYSLSTDERPPIIPEK